VGALKASNVEEAAKSIGMSANSLMNWMKRPDFDAAYREARRLAFRQSIARLQQAKCGGDYPAEGHGGSYRSALHTGSSCR